MRLLIALCVTLFALPAVAQTKVELALELDRPSVPRGGEAGLEVLAHIQRGWHINARRPNEKFLIPTEVKFTAPTGVEIDEPTYPPPDERQFAFAGGKTLLVYEGKLGITTGIKIPASYKEDFVRIEAELRYQACNDSTCSPPATARAELTISVTSAAALTSDDGSQAIAGGGGLDVGGWLAQRGLAATLLIVFFLGLGLNLTPCVYPLISVTIAYFGSQAHHRTAKTVRLALLYVLGVTLSFASVGVAAALSGGIFGAALQKPAVILAISGVLTALALSSFGVYQMQAPAWVMQRVGAAAPGALGSFLMGATMGIVAAPCVGPVVIGLLVFVGARQDALLGLMLFFALGLGLGTPYLGLALAAGSLKKLPRSGEWMMWVERLFGFMLLGMAIHFVRPLLPELIRPWVLPALLAAAGLYLGFIDPSGRTMPRFRTLQWSTGALGLVLAGWMALPPAAQSAIHWQAFDGEKTQVAARPGRPAVIDFVADWCIPCHEMDNTTYRDVAVIQETRRFEMFRADMTRESDTTAALADRFGVEGVPTIIYIDSKGQEIHRSVGYVSAEEMLATMRRVS